MGSQILVAEDDAGLRSMIEEYLTDEGYSVRTAATGEEALAGLLAAPADLLLLDLALPVKAGWDVIADARSAGVTTPVVLMTGQYRADMEAELCGADGALAKPFDLDTLLQIVQRWVPPAEREARAG